MPFSQIFGAAPPSKDLVTLFGSRDYQVSETDQPGRDVFHNLGNVLDGLLDSRRLEPYRGGWPVRDQRYGNTCVAFTSTAAMELYRALRETGAPVTRLSPGFVYNRMRKGLNKDYLANLPHRIPEYIHGATLLAQALCTFRQFGCCTEVLRPYDGSQPQTSLAGPDPKTDETADAAMRRHQNFYYADRNPGPRAVQFSINLTAPRSSETTVELSASLLARILLFLRSPVSVGIPVFGLPGGWDNWSWAAPRKTGFVRYPGADFPVSTAVEETPKVVGGHAVCITGFVADPTDIREGWFIFRNSWGYDFHTSGDAPPDIPQVNGLPVGYGILSRAAVDKYVWEILAPTDIDYSPEDPCVAK